MSSSTNYLAERVRSFGGTIFGEMTALSLKYQSVNLGQGFPNFPCPDFMKETAIEAIRSDYNQYARGTGSLSLVENLAEFYSPRLQRTLEGKTEIVVTVGATEALFATCQAFLNPGDEVILFEPFYDSYPASVTMAGGVPVYLPLTPNAEGRWIFSEEELKKCFTSKTKLIFVNTPQNPTGKVFTQKELELIAELCLKYDVIAVCDEVYEHILFSGQHHISLATLPGMWDRTLTISSAGKTFSVTGWKIGWVIAPAELVRGIQNARQWISFSVATPFQEAVANALKLAPKAGYFEELGRFYEKKRDFLVAGLQSVGFRPFVPEGTYFIMADCQALGVGAKDDLEFCKYLTQHRKVTAIPPSFFYSDAHKSLAKQWARFSFCKEDATLQQAIANLKV
ncbi:MAG: aminotransferase class I/II-fold pyridoxal phosphate-dependent enzyme [Planctomycetota bacterium]